MTRRDHFAGLAMQTLLQHYLKTNTQNMIISTNLENLTLKAWQIADVMETQDIKQDT